MNAIASAGRCSQDIAAKAVEAPEIVYEWPFIAEASSIVVTSKTT